jgi:MFS family permease
VAATTPRDLLVLPGLKRFLLARVLTTLAVQAFSVIVGWQIFAWTKSPLMLGILGAVQFVPMLLLTPLAGQIVDRTSRRNLSALTIATGTLVLLGLTVLSGMGEKSVFALMALASLLGAVRAFAGPALSAMVPELVPAELLPRALAVAGATFQVAMVGGPALAGFVFAKKGATFGYGLGVACLAASAVLLASLPGKPPPAKREETRGDVFAGMRFVWKKRVLFGAISLDLFAVLLGGAVALLPAVAQEVLHVGPTAFGWLRSAPAIGATFTGLLLARWPIERHVGRIMLAAVFAFGLCTIGFGLSRDLTLSFALLALAGASDMVSVVVRHSLVQIETPDDMRGRVSAVSMLFIGASNELGELESGLTAAWLGVTSAIILGGVGTLLVVLSWAYLFPDLRRVQRFVPTH